MAFFNFRLPGRKTGGAVAAAPAESVEALRRRARHRLIGAALLVLVAVIGFPLVFDTQPRPVAVDVPIEIPDRAKVKPLTLPAAELQGKAAPAGPLAPAADASAAPAASAAKVAAAPAAAPAAAGSSRVAAGASLDAREEIVSEKSESKQAQPIVKRSSSAINSESVREPATATSPGAVGKPEGKAEVKPEAKAPAVKPADDGSRARALLEGKDVPKPAAVDGQRFIVQVGAFADPVKAHGIRIKIERAGLKTYTHVVETAEGKRIRVRVGPFTSRAEADKAAARIHGLDLPAAILTL